MSWSTARGSSSGLSLEGLTKVMAHKSYICIRWLKSCFSELWKVTLSIYFTHIFSFLHSVSPSEPSRLDCVNYTTTLDFGVKCWFSSLLWLNLLSKSLFSYNGVYWVDLMLSIRDVIVSQKPYNGEWKKHFFGRDNNFTCSLCAKKHLWGNTFWVDPFPPLVTSKELLN